MKEYLKKFPPEIAKLVFLVGETASKSCTCVYLVGGCVRDFFLRAVHLDLDFVVEGDGIAFAEQISRRLHGKLIRHRRFGTATIVTSNIKIDITSSRKESYAYPAALPEVSCGSLCDDLFRRDFSINAMALNITGNAAGELIDLFAGKKDLQRKNIRVLHDLSFIDDPTRMLRAIRFEQRFNFKIEPHTLRLLKEAAAKGMLKKVNSQRLRDELILILKENNPLRQIRRMDKLTGFDFIDSKISGSRKMYKLLRSVSETVNWFNKQHAQRRKIDAWLIYLMGLANCLSVKQVKLLCRNFAFRKGEELRLVGAKQAQDYLSRVISRGKSTPSSIFALLEPLSYETILFIRAISGRTEQRKIDDFFLCHHGSRLQISGQDIARLGIAPGPKYQEIFSKVLHAKVDGLIKTKADELKFLKSIAKGVH